MSSKSAPSPAPSGQPTGEDTPRVRRISNPRPRKSAGAATESADGTDAALTVQAPKVEKYPEFADSPTIAPERGDWPEPEAVNVNAGGQLEHGKRKRRRKKGKGHNPPATGTMSEEEHPTQAQRELGEADATVSATAAALPVHPSHTQRAKIDPEVLATRAWKIYLSEVSEEGVALIGDNDAKELSRRCFRLAEIFIEEQARRR